MLLLLASTNTSIPLTFPLRLLSRIKGKNPMLVEIEATSIKKIELRGQQPEGILNTPPTVNQRLSVPKLETFIFFVCKELVNLITSRYVILFPILSISSLLLFCSKATLNKFYLNKFSVDSFAQYFIMQYNPISVLERDKTKLLTE